MTRPHHPQPTVIATYLRRIAAQLDDRGLKAIETAAVLAARGYPANTAGGTKSSDSTSSTERAALNNWPWAGIDERLAQELHLIWLAGTHLEHTLTDVLAHASDDDPIPAGTGHCQRCETFCRPDADHPDNRIRSGYCPACYKRWLRLGRPDRRAFERTHVPTQGTRSTSTDAAAR